MSRPGLPLSPSVLVALALAGCASAPTAEERAAGAPEAPAWVAAPAGSWDERSEPLVLQVTGSAVIAPDLAAAEQAARADALAVIGAFLDGAAAQLGAAAAPAAGVATGVQSARVRGKFHDGRRFFVWMSCDAGVILSAGAPPDAREELARLVARRNRG